jgi:hypothetical protein
MAQPIIRWQADNKIFFRAPTDYTDVNDPIPMAAPDYDFPGLVSRLYDASKRTTTRVEMVATDAVAFVDSANAFEVDDVVEYIVLDTANFNAPIRLTNIIADVDTLEDTITLTNPIGTDELLEKGSIIQTKLGSDVTMAESSGTPVIDTDLQGNFWGYEGTIESTHVGLKTGMQVRIEMPFTSSGTVPGITDYPILPNVPVLEQSG